MNTAEFLSHLHELEIDIWVEEGQLRCKGPKHALTESLQTEIKSRKTQLLEFLHTLRKNQAFPAPPIQKVKRNGGLPLSFSQQRLWFLHQLEPNGTGYHSPLVVWLKGPLRVSALKQSLQIVVDRHESLRTTFPLIEGQPIQVIASQLNVPWQVMNMPDVPAADREEWLRSIVREEIGRPFNLVTGPVFRVLLVQVEKEEYVLIITLHHIMSDGWSLGILCQELEAAYSALIEEQFPTFPPLPIQYGDFAVWQRNWLQGVVLERQLTYWGNKLANLAPLVLPSDQPRQALQTYNGNTVGISFPLELSRTIAGFSQTHGVTLYITLLAAFKILLAKYTGQTDIVVGSPIANRNQPELERLIGIFVNSIVLRTDLAGNPSFEDLVDRVKETSLGAFDHQDLPFERLVEELQPTRDPSRNPLFQVMFSVQNVPYERLRLPGLTILNFDRGDLNTRFDLECYVWEGNDGGLTVNLIYNSDLFRREFIEQLGRHYQRILEGVVPDPLIRLSEVAFLEEHERRELLGEGNNSPIDSHKDQSISQLFEEMVKTHPEKVALIRDEVQLTYRQLSQRSNQLAHYLRRQGVGPEKRVGVCMERGVDLVICLLGILKAGGAYVPLDPNYPPDRVAYLLDDAQVTLLLTSPTQIPQLPPYSGLLLTPDWKAISRESVVVPPVLTHPENLAYVLYTSGSTGRPKGVMITQENVMTFLNWVHQVFSKEDLTGVLASTSVCFDLSIFELFGPLTHGGTVVVVDNALSLSKLVDQDRVTLVNTVPSAMRELVSRQRPPGVRIVNLAGEPLHASLVKQIYQEWEVDKVHDLYGPSETTTYATFGVRLPAGPATIGRPLSTTTVNVLDGGGQLVPRGVKGELSIGGGQVARGYWQRPTMTAQNFVPHPYSSQPGRRIYRTGDQVRWTREGDLEFHGRQDGQIKVRGYRIELGEIEVAVSQHPDIQEVVVLCREDSPGGKELVAYVVGEKIKEVVPVLRAYLLERLPEYMVPSVFVVLDLMPLTPNGKIDKASLPPPDSKDRTQGARYIPPQGTIQQGIAKIWKEVLQVEKVGIHDNFFDLGGHSLLLAKVQWAFQTQLECSVSMVECFKYPTIYKMANYLQSGLESSVSVATKIEDFPRKIDKRKNRMKKLSSRRITTNSEQDD